MFGWTVNAYEVKETKFQIQYWTKAYEPAKHFKNLALQMVDLNYMGHIKKKTHFRNLIQPFSWVDVDFRLSKPKTVFFSDNPVLRLNPNPNPKNRRKRRQWQNFYQIISILSIEWLNSVSDPSILNPPFGFSETIRKQRNENPESFYS